MDGQMSGHTIIRLILLGQAHNRMGGGGWGGGGGGRSRLNEQTWEKILGIITISFSFHDGA